MKLKHFEILAQIVGVGIALLLLASAISNQLITDCQNELEELRQLSMERLIINQWSSATIHSSEILSRTAAIQNYSTESKYFKEVSNTLIDSFKAFNQDNSSISTFQEKREDCDNLSSIPYYLSFFAFIAYFLLICLFIKIFKKLRE